MAPACFLKFGKEPVEQRINIRRGNGGLGSGNWLAFCIANRWIRRAFFLPNKHYRASNNGFDDLMFCYFPELDEGPEGSQLLELIPLPPTHSFSLGGDWKKELAQQQRTEPSVPWWTLEEDKFCLPFRPDYVIVCQSPGFTPPKADALIDVIREYLNVREDFPDAEDIQIR